MEGFLLLAVPLVILTLWAWDKLVLHRPCPHCRTPHKRGAKVCPSCRAQLA